MDRIPVTTTDAARPKGPYSQAIVYGDLLFVSGAGPFDPDTGRIVGSGIVDQARATLRNLKAIVEASGFHMERALKATVFLADFDDFAAFNAAYEEFLSAPFPARSVIQAARLALDSKCSVDIIVGR